VPIAYWRRVYHQRGEVGRASAARLPRVAVSRHSMMRIVSGLSSTQGPGSGWLVLGFWRSFVCNLIQCPSCRGFLPLYRPFTRVERASYGVSLSELMDRFLSEHGWPNRQCEPPNGALWLLLGGEIVHESCLSYPSRGLLGEVPSTICSIPRTSVGCCLRNSRTEHSLARRHISNTPHVS
jgi:hypothetical protein